MKKLSYLFYIFIIISLLLTACRPADPTIDLPKPQNETKPAFGDTGNLRSAHFVPFLEGTAYASDGIIYFASKGEEKKITEGTLLGQANGWLYYLKNSQVFAYDKSGNSIPCISSGAAGLSFFGCFDGKVLFFGNGQLYLINQADHSIIDQMELGEKQFAAPFLHENDLYWIGGRETAWELLKTDLSDRSTESLAELSYIGTEKCSVAFLENRLYYFACYKLFCYDIAENAVREIVSFKEGDNCAMWNGCAYVGIIGNAPELQIYDLKTEKRTETIPNAGGPESNEYGILWFENNSVVAHLKNGATIQEELSSYETYFNVLPLKNGILIPTEEQIHMITPK